MSDMRELKFRAWYDKSQTWVYIHIGQAMTDEGRKIYEEMCIDGVSWLQLTGLKDKKGVDIYEGDIVKIKKHTHMKYSKWKKEDFIGELKWNYQAGGFYISNNNRYVEIGYCAQEGGENGIYLTSAEAIGNIQENPELLK